MPVIRKKADRIGQAVSERLCPFKKRYAVYREERLPKNPEKSPTPPKRCSGLTANLFQNHTEIMSMKPLTERLQSYLVRPEARGRWLTTSSPILKPLIFRMAGIKRCIS